MAGLTDSDTILKALNEAVKAINDLILGGGDGDTTVNVTNEVVPATVNVYPQIRVNCGCGGGSDIGSGSPIDDDEATGTTPPQAGAPVDEAKCKRVNFIIDKYINFMGIWSAVNGLLAIGPAEMMAAYLAGTSTLLGAFSGLLVAGAVVTLFWAVVALFIGGALTTTYIVAHLVSVNSNRADWVCAMYNAGDVAELRQAIVDFLGDNLAGLPQSFVEYHVDHLFPNNVLNGVFNGWTGDVAAELDAYTSPADCGGCVDGVEGCDALIGPHSASAKQIFTNPDRWGIAAHTEDGADFPEMKNLGCHFGFKDNRVTVSGFNSYGTLFNVQYRVYGGKIYDLYVADINNYVFDQMYSEFAVYQSLTPFTLSFEVDRTQASPA